MRAPLPTHSRVMYGRLKPVLKRSKFLVALAGAMRLLLQGYRETAWSLSRSRVIRGYLRSQPVRKLQLGAGPNPLAGWLNTDLRAVSPGCIFLDASRPLPFGDETFDYIFSEHLVEHLSYGAGLSMLRECYRVLKPGGRIRVATPDLETVIGLHTVEKSDIQQRYINWVVDRYLPEVDGPGEAFVINNMFRNFGHQFIYDWSTLRSALGAARFIDVARYSVGESNDDNFRGIESHNHSEDGGADMNRFEAMVLEARRPEDQSKATEQMPDGP